MRYLIMQGNVNDNTQWNEWINAVWIIFTFIDIEFLINFVRNQWLWKSTRFNKWELVSKEREKEKKNNPSKGSHYELEVSL